MNFINKYKGYVIHAAAVLVVFLSPSVQAFAVAHPAYAAIATLAYGYALHWASGK
jgi:hypothetical protein